LTRLFANHPGCWSKRNNYVNSPLDMRRPIEIWGIAGQFCGRETGQRAMIFRRQRA
jgi:hypothetical protein